MVIKLEGFEIHQCDWNGRWTRFDLYRLHERKEGKKVGEIVRKAELYHGTIQQCLDVIVQKRLGEIKEINLEQFLKQYEDITVKIKEDILTVTKSFKEYFK